MWRIPLQFLYLWDEKCFNPNFSGEPILWRRDKNSLPLKVIYKTHLKFYEPREMITCYRSLISKRKAYVSYYIFASFSVAQLAQSEMVTTSISLFDDINLDRRGV